MSTKRLIFPGLFCTLGCSVWLPSLFATQLLRGPYLQAPTPDSVIIRWRTDVATPSRVAYGALGGGLSSSAVDATLTTDHTMRLTGLTPSTLYSYSVGSAGETLAQGPDCRFSTAPLPGQSAPTRIWVTGDSGGFSLGATNVIRMRDAYRAYAGGRQADIWLALGDNAYNEGTEESYQADFFDVFSQLLRQVSPWPTIGNHEAYAAASDGSFPYLTMFSFLTNGEAGGVSSGTPRYYSFDYANIHFVCLDAMTQSRASDGAMAKWLGTDLEATSSEWIIAFWHHPPYSKGSHDSDSEPELIEMRENILPILEARGVDLVVCGHSHGYERSFLMRGHYGMSTTLQPSMILDHGSGRENETGAYMKPTSGPLANQGTVYVVAGNSASCDGIASHHPAMAATDASIGSLVIDVNAHRLDATYLSCGGAVHDTFTLIKADPEPLRFSSFVVQNGNAIATWNSIRGRTYRVEQTDNLQTPNWQPASGPVVAGGTTTSWTNTVDPGVSSSYFRVTRMAP